MDKQFRDGLTRITKPTGKATQRLPPLELPDPIPGGVGVGTNSGGGTAGIASPLTEVKPPQREYYATRQVKSSDGLFAIDHQPLKSIAMTDANGAAVTLVFQDPDA